MAISNIKHNIQQAAPSVGPKCTVCKFQESLGGEELEAFMELLTDPNITYQSISLELRKDPDYHVDLAASTLARHSTGKCAARHVLRPQA